MPEIPIPYTSTNESITVILEGESFTIKAGDKNFDAVLLAIANKAWSAIPPLISKGKAIEEWAQGVFTFKHNYLLYQGERVPMEINTKFLAMAEAGEDPRPVMRFFQRLQHNPSYRSVQQLFRFVAQEKIPIGQDGCLLAYKAVKRDYWDKHSGNSFRFQVGAVIEMPRNQISDDPKVACAPGLHVGARDYLGSDGKTGPKDFGNGDLWMIVKVDPADVVSVPYDYKSRKMRVCKMVVVGHYGSDLPDTIWEDEILSDVNLSDIVEPRRYAAEKLQTPRPLLDEDLPELPASALEPMDSIEIVVKLDAPVELPFDHSLKAFDRAEGLGERTLADLRDYAKSLGIKNVKAIAGGKVALIERIIAVENDQVQAQTKHAEKTETPQGEVTYADVHAMGGDALVEQSLSVLRKYARHHLKIVGASKIHGGKLALVARIVDVRNQTNP